MSCPTDVRDSECRKEVVHHEEAHREVKLKRRPWQ